jgi:hypothetical protein
MIAPFLIMMMAFYNGLVELTWRDLTTPNLSSPRSPDQQLMEHGSH